MTHGPDGEFTRLVDDNPFGHTVGRQDCDLGPVDDRERPKGAVPARVRDREGAPPDLVGRELASPRPLREIMDGAGHAAHTEPIGTDHRRNHEPLVAEIDGNTEIDLPVLGDDAVGSDSRVARRVPAQRGAHRDRDKRQCRERETLLVREAVAEHASGQGDSTVVAGGQRVGVRGLLCRCEQRRTGPLLYAIERHPPVWLGCREHVGRAHPTIEAGTRE
jgi:hypothetical protein